MSTLLSYPLLWAWLLFPKTVYRLITGEYE